MSRSRSSLAAINYITGISDGLLLPVIPCALILLNIAAANAFWLVLAAFIVALAYGAARFLGEREEIKHHHPRFAKEDAPQDEKLLQHIGIEDTLVSNIMEQVKQEQQQWLQEIRDHEMDWEEYDPRRALKGGLQTGAGFLIGALIGSVPFLLACSGIVRLIGFGCIEAGIMLLFGWLKGKYLDRDPLPYAVMQLLLCILLLLVPGLVLILMPGWFF